MINTFEEWFLRRIIRKIARRSDREASVVDLFNMLRLVWRDRFYEDNVFTRQDHLRELFQWSEDLETAREIVQ